jgi:hypothetical protein
MRLKVRINNNVVYAYCSFALSNNILRIVCNVIDGNIDSLTIIYDVANSDVKISVVKGKFGEIVYGNGKVSMNCDDGDYIGWIFAEVDFNDSYSDDVIAGIGIEQ